MLMIEDIKKCCRYTNGYYVEVYANETVIVCPSRLLRCTDEIEFIKDIYPGFIQEVIEGLLFHCTMAQISNKNGFYIRDENKIIEKWIEYGEDNLTSKESAVNFLLGIAK